MVLFYGERGAVSTAAVSTVLVRLLPWMQAALGPNSYLDPLR